MEWAGVIKGLLSVISLALYFVIYSMGKRAGMRKGRELQRREDEIEIQEFKKQLAETLYKSSADPNANLSVLQKLKAIRKLPPTTT